jgi:flagellar motility protein MotE (MotC chaperone)
MSLKMAIIIGGGSFAIFLIVFVLTMGMFSSESVQEEVVEDLPAELEEDYEYLSGDWHGEYSPLAKEGSEQKTQKKEETKDSTLSEEDSIEQVKWYQAQKEEIEREWLRLQAERAKLENLRAETKALIEQRRNLEQTNIANLAKLFDTMKPEEVAAIMENISDAKVGLILQRMRKQNGAEVMAELPSERAAQITMQMIDLDGVD